MEQQVRHGVTIDWCPSCAGLWFDIEEIEAYLNARGTRTGQPVPRNTELEAAGGGAPETCTCCGEPALRTGTLRGFSYLRCSWCGGVFLAKSELDKVQSEPKIGRTTPPLPRGQGPLDPIDGIDLVELVLQAIGALFR
jgi:Zn-finger nucleic acid-binding protein